MALDREAIRKAAASRRTVDEPQPVAKSAWRCDFCLRDFQTETGFMRHYCEERERLEILKSPRGQAAYSMYSEWMRLQRRSVPSPQTFSTSKQWNYFLRFAEWSEKTAIPNTNQFIKLMVETGTQPVLWCRSQTYALYLQWYDNAYPPEQQFIETFDRLQSMAIDHRCSPAELYQVLGPFEIANLVRRRKLSPWLLVVSPRFLKYASSLSQQERDVLNTAIDFGVYAKKLQQLPDLAREFKRACESEDI